MNQPAIKEAAEAFMQALMDCKNPIKIAEIFYKNRAQDSEADLKRCIAYETNLVNHVIAPYQPIYDLAINGEIDEPFDIGGYMQAKTGRVLIESLDYPEITDTRHALCRALQGGLTIEEFWQSRNYKERLLPKKMRVAYVAPYDPGVNANVALSTKELLELAEKSRKAI